MLLTLTRWSPTACLLTCMPLCMPLELQPRFRALRSLRLSKVVVIAKTVAPRISLSNVAKGHTSLQVGPDPIVHKVNQLCLYSHAGIPVRMFSNPGARLLPRVYTSVLHHSLKVSLETSSSRHQSDLLLSNGALFPPEGSLNLGYGLKV